MIFDSHAHYNNNAYKKPFRYLTDAPYILPYCRDVFQPKLLRRARNTSLILPAVINKITKLKGISTDEVEKATTENVVRLFRLPVELR